MIETVLVDELRTRLDEDFVRAHCKAPPEPAAERVTKMLTVQAKGSRKMGMSRERAEQMARDASAYDLSLTKGRR